MWNYFTQTVLVLLTNKSSQDQTCFYLKDIYYEQLRSNNNINCENLILFLFLK